MIQIHIIRDKSGIVREYEVRGHAGSDEYGRDIVCAAVSVIAYMGVNALDELAGIKLYDKGTGEFVERDGYMRCVLPLDIDPDKMQTVKVILDTMVVGFKQLVETPDYKRYISISDEEV
ncbi:MAG TPA: ribosomal-processing cysteine protease Prp [Pseudobacteroides sp.]|nr:ribosomal-processing cysteine protease Prp [Pseudobacteroides sp.]